MAIDTNRAHALLFLRRLNDARKLYLAHKGKRIGPDSDKTWEDVIAEDFDALRAAGIMHKGFPRIVAELGVKSPELSAKIEATRNEVNRLHVVGQYREATTAAETLIDLTSRRFGEGRSEFATASEWLALSKQRLGETAEAEPLYWRSLAIREKALGPEHRDVGTSLNNLAELYREQGRYAEAEPLYKRSLNIREKALGPEHPDVGQSLNDLASLYRAQDRYAEAEPLYKRSLNIREKALGPKHPDVGQSLNDLASLYRDQDRYAEAEPLYKRSLAISEKALGPEHPDVATSLNELAALYRAQGRYAEAEPLLKRSLAISEKALGPEHPDVATSLNNLAALYQDLGRYAEAEPLYQRTVSIFEKALGPDHSDVGQSLINLAALYQDLGRYAEAEPLYQRTVSIFEKGLGPEHRDVGRALNNLASLYRTQGRYAEAEPLLKRSLAIREKVLGPEHRDVCQSLNNLALLYRAQGRYAEAEPLYRRALAIYEKAPGPEHADVGRSLHNLAELYRAQGLDSKAEPLYKRSLAIYEKALGSEHRDVGRSLNDLASLYRDQDRYAEAEPLYKRSIAVYEKVLAPDHPEVGVLLNNLALLYQAQGRYAEAEPLLKRSLAISERTLAPDHPEVGTSLNNLAALYNAQGRYTEAEPLYKRSLTISEKALGPEHRDVGRSLNNLAALYQDQGRYAEAEPLYKRSLTISEKALGPDHRDVGQSLNNLASLYRDLDRYAEAEPLYKRSLTIREKALGPDHRDVGQSLNNLALLYWAQGRYAEAEPLFTRSVAVYEKALGFEHPDVGSSLNDLAGLYFSQRDWVRAADFYRSSTSIVIRRAQRGSDDVGQALTGRRKEEAEQERHRFWGLVKAVHHLAVQDSGAHANLAREMFQAAQWAQGSEAAASLAQMAARGAKGDPKLAALVRERQDLVGEWQRRDGVRSAAVAQAPDKRDRPAEAANVARLAAIDARIGEIDKTLRETFPDYAVFARPTPLSVDDVQAELRTGEALVLSFDTPKWKPAPEETFLWVVTKSDVRWVRSELGTKGLTERVAALRCGIDETLWKGIEEGRGCRRLLGLGSDFKRGSEPPFHLGVAHELYTELFGQVEDLIKDKHLLIVPSGPLTSLPFAALVTEKPEQALPSDAEGYRRAAWLGTRQPITVLPAVSSLYALRGLAKNGGQAAEPYIGFGDPELKGRVKECAKPPRLPADCPSVAGRTDMAMLMSGDGGTRSPDELSPSEEFFKGGLADPVVVRSQCPLPESAFELRCVAKSLQALPGVVHTRQQATETALKAMPLDRYRVIHFATHGLLAVDTEKMAKGLAEPALVFTPPAGTATAEDDGLLTASEIAQLKLNAEWVILSACNTAGSADKPGVEALSGLARAFFYAGARALLVSHWRVDSLAAVLLISTAMEELRANPDVGRSEALRRSMAALIANGMPTSAHPFYWAPFVVVGEGAR